MNNQALKLKVSDNGHFLQYENGNPFFYLADTAWELFHRLTLEEIGFYLDIRKEQGYTVIQSVLISEMNGLRTGNAYGQFPFIDTDPSKPNPDYFEFVHEVIRLARSRKMYMALVPSWGDKIDKAFGIGPEIFNETNAFAYGKWLGKNFREIPNIIWMNGGDRSGDGRNYAVWNALGEGIKSEDPGHLMTFHPWGEASSSMWFHHSGWLDFNSCQSGHSMRNYPNYMMIIYDYLRLPAKPCLDAEPRYEEHAVNWKPEENGIFDDYDVRQAAYWSVFAGACGHTYGAHPVWQMADKKRDPVGFVKLTWIEALTLPGASQMIHLKNLMLSRPYLDRVPDQSLLTSPKVGDEHICATRGKNYILTYLPRGGIVEINASTISHSQVNAWWYNPRTGAAEFIGNMDNNSLLSFTSPLSGRFFDWVLVLDDPESRFNIPGKTMLS